MTYQLNFKKEAEQDLTYLKRSEPIAYQKVQKLLLELIEHPLTGTGKPELLKGNLAGCYSRRISQKHRLVYQIFNQEVIVLVLAAAGHYSDK
jgi:toxin YoeB